ncbi:hypothetical protein NMY22_g15056 [Coprinellus aureogranulatus]|nr:hypothetical protein NMY22_g15056 [Coprinellus aureogranulatus]
MAPSSKAPPPGKGYRIRDDAGQTWTPEATGETLWRYTKAQAPEQEKPSFYTAFYDQADGSDMAEGEARKSNSLLDGIERWCVTLKHMVAGVWLTRLDELQHQEDKLYHRRPQISQPGVKVCNDPPMCAITRVQ